MQRWKGIRPHTIVAFLIGVFIATAGTATAAKVITGRDIRNGSITEKDLSVALRQKLSVQVIEGPKGEAGAKGDTGSTGPAGAAGVAGAAGAKGDAGAAGADGAQGAKGDAGDPGAPGADGADGTNGTNGAQGIQGIQGPKGDKGETGATGPAGTASVTVRFGPPVTIDALSAGRAEATCATDEVAVGGAGYFTASTASAVITGNLPTFGGDPMGPGLAVPTPGPADGWRVEGFNSAPVDSVELVAEVLCAPSA
jgi:hypothetical protein